MSNAQETRMMRQARITGPGEPLQLVDVPIHQAPAKGLLLKTVFCGVCHSDLNIIKQSKAVQTEMKSRGFAVDGIVPGHEISGIIMSFGAEAPADEYGLEVGDRVSVFAWIGCGKCEMCSNDYSNHCVDEQSRIRGAGLYWMGCSFSRGGYQEYVPISDCKYALKLPATISMEVGCMIPCSGLTAYSALNKAKPHLESALERRGKARLMVLGTGGVGLWALGLAKVVFAGEPVEVIAADISPDKIDSAWESGADDAILLSVKDDVAASTEKITANGRMDAVLDFVGTEGTAQLGLACLQYNGGHICVGMAGGHLDLPIRSLIIKSLSMQGSAVGNLREQKELMELVMKHRVSTPKIEYYTLDECNIALDKLRAGEIKGRALLKFD